MRMTKLTTEVQTLFQQAQQPLSVACIQKNLQAKGLTPNKTTLYRMLDRFCETGITKKLVLTDDAAHYEKMSDPHGHFVCQGCEHVECLPTMKVPFSLPEMQNLLPQGKVSSVDFSLQGQCKNCLS